MLQLQQVVDQDFPLLDQNAQNPYPCFDADKTIQSDMKNTQYVQGRKASQNKLSRLRLNEFHENAVLKGKLRTELFRFF